MGRNDIAGGALRSSDGTYGRCDECGAGQRRGSHLSVHYHGRGGGSVDGADGDSPEGGTGEKAHERNQPFFEISISPDSLRASCRGVHSSECDRQCAGAGLGLHAGGAEGHGGAGEAGGRAGDAGVCG